MGDESRKKLYDALTKNGFNIGTYDAFNAKMDIPESRKKLYDAVGARGFSLGSYEDYENKIGALQGHVGPVSPREMPPEGPSFLRQAARQFGRTPVGQALSSPGQALSQGLSEITTSPLRGIANLGNAALRTGALPLTLLDASLEQMGSPATVGGALSVPFQAAAGLYEQGLTSAGVSKDARQNMGFEPETASALSELVQGGSMIAAGVGTARALPKKVAPPFITRPKETISAAEVSDVGLPPSVKAKIVAELGPETQTRFGQVKGLSDADLTTLFQEKGLDKPAPLSEAPVSQGGDLSVRGPANQAQIQQLNPLEPPKPGFIQNINPERLQQEALPKIAEIAKPEEAQRRGVRTHEQTVEAAKRQGETVQKALNGEYRPGTAFNAEQLEALDSALNNLAKRTPEEALSELGEKGLTNLLRTVQGAHAEAGRSLNILSKEVDPGVARAFVRISEAVKDPETVAAIKDVIARLEKKEAIPPGMWDKVAEFGRNVKLASISGLVRSTVGNSVMALAKYPEMAMSAQVNKVLASIFGQKRDRFSEEIAADIVGSKSGVKEGMKKAWDTLNELPAALQENEFFLNEFGRTGGAIEGTKGLVIRMPQKLQGAIDAAFRVPQFRGALGRQAVRKAFSENLKGEAWTNRVQELIENPDAEMIKAASADSKYRTYQSKLGSLGQGVNQLRMSHPSLQILQPFFSTATNLFKTLVEHTPLAPLTASFQQSVLEAFTKGKPSDMARRYAKLTGRDFEPGVGHLSDKISRVVTGTAFITATGTVVTKVLDGEISGRGPKTSAERDALYRQGWQPSSIRLGDTWYSYRGFEPLTGWLTSYADFRDGAKEGGVEAVRRGTVGVVRNFVENPFLVGTKDAMEALTADEGQVDKFISGVAVGMVVPTIVRQTTSVIDPTYRKPQGIAENVQSKIPFLSKSLLPKRDVFGEPVQKESPVGALVGMSTSTVKNDPVESELSRLKLTLSWPSDMYGGVELSPEQHDKLMEVAGKSLKQVLTQLVKAPVWKQMTDGLKIDAIRNSQNLIREAQRGILFPDVKEQSLLNKADRNLTGGAVTDDQKERTLQALRRAVGQ